MSGNRLKVALAGLGVASILAACTGGAATTSAPASAPATAAPPATTAPASAPASAEASPSGAAGLTCDAKQFGPLTQCLNFYTDYWPVMEAKLQELLPEAQKANNGDLTVWGWFEVDEATKEAFAKQYPGINITSEGLQYNLTPKIVAAAETGSDTTDVLGGVWVGGEAIRDKGLHAQIDWTEYGIPKEFLSPEYPWFFPDGTNGWLISYNKTKVDAPPTNLADYLDPKWKGRIAMDPSFVTFFSGYGMKHGQDAMVKLMKDLKDSGNLVLTDDPDTLLEAGDVWVKFDAQNFTQNPDIGVAAFEDSVMWRDYAGVNKDGKNQAAGTLFSLWNAFDPDWNMRRTTEEAFQNSGMPYVGIGPEVLDHMSPSKTANLAEWQKGLSNGWTIIEGPDNMTELAAMEDATREVFK